MISKPDNAAGEITFSSLFHRRAMNVALRQKLTPGIEGLLLHQFIA